MNENTVKGNMKKLEGKIQEKWGQMTNDPADIAEGRAKQAAGSMRHGAGRIQDEL